MKTNRTHSIIQLTKKCWQCNKKNKLFKFKLYSKFKCSKCSKCNLLFYLWNENELSMYSKDFNYIDIKTEDFFNFTILIYLRLNSELCSFGFNFNKKEFRKLNLIDFCLKQKNTIEKNAMFL